MGLFGHRSLKRTILWGTAQLPCNRTNVEINCSLYSYWTCHLLRPWIHMFSLQSHVRAEDRARFKWTSEGNVNIQRTKSGVIKNVSHGSMYVCFTWYTHMSCHHTMLTLCLRFEMQCAYLDSSLWVVSQVGRKKTEEYPIISHQILFEDRGVPSEILPWHFAKSRLISLRADCFIRYVFELFSWTPRRRHHSQQSPMIMPSTRDPMVLLLGVLKKQCNMPHHSDFVHTTSTDTGSHRYVGRCFFGISACTSFIVSTQIFVMCVVRRAQEPFISFLRGEERALRFRPRPHVPMRSTPMSRTELGKCSTLILQG